MGLNGTSLAVYAAASAYVKPPFFASCTPSWLSDEDGTKEVKLRACALSSEDPRRMGVCDSGEEVRYPWPNALRRVTTGGPA